MNKLKVDKCNNDDEMVWKSNKSCREIHEMKAGNHIMGDIDQLGWAVIKQFVHGPEESKIFQEREGQTLQISPEADRIEVKVKVMVAHTM